MVAYGFHDLDIAVGHGPVQVRRVPELEFVGLICDPWAGGLGEGDALGFGQQVGLIFFQGNDPAQAQGFEGTYAGGLQIDGVGYQHIQKAAPQTLDELLQ